MLYNLLFNCKSCVLRMFCNMVKYALNLAVAVTETVTKVFPIKLEMVIA